jgi:hypothetical protein
LHSPLILIFSPEGGEEMRKDEISNGVKVRVFWLASIDKKKGGQCPPFLNLLLLLVGNKT